jgi:hypothetical protein
VRPKIIGEADQYEKGAVLLPADLGAGGVREPVTFQSQPEFHASLRSPPGRVSSWRKGTFGQSYWRKGTLCQCGGLAWRSDVDLDESGHFGRENGRFRQDQLRVGSGQWSGLTSRVGTAPCSFRTHECRRVGTGGELVSRCARGASVRCRRRPRGARRLASSGRRRGRRVCPRRRSGRRRGRRQGRGR